MKVGLIRCMQTEDMCPATTCFKVIKNHKCAFEKVEEAIEVVGMTTCGGCPGKKAVTRAEMMVKRGADTIVLASCMTKGNPVGFVCPHVDKIKEAVGKRIGKEIQLMEYTH